MVSVVNNNMNRVNIVSDFDSDLSKEDFENSNNNFLDEDVNDEVKISPNTTVNAKVVQAMKRLQALYNDDANEIVEQAMNEKSVIIKKLNFLINLSMVTTDTEPVPEEPKTFTKVWNYPNPNSHTKCREVIKNEFANMNKQQVWWKTKKSRMPPN